MRFLKPELVSYTFDAFIGMGQQVFSFGNNAVVDSLLSADAGMFPYQSIKIIWMDPQCRGV